MGAKQRQAKQGTVEGSIIDSRAVERDSSDRSSGLAEQKPSLAEQVRSAQVELLYKQLVPALVATLANSVLLGAVMWRVVDRPVIIAWVVASWALSALRYALALAYRRRSVDSDRPWERYFLIGTVLAGALWGSASLLLFPVGSSGHQAFLALLLCGMCTAAVASLGPILVAFLSFLVPTIVPLAARFLMLSEASAAGMGFLAICFILATTMVARRFNASVRESLTLRFENVELIERLSNARRDAEAASRSKSQFLANMSHEIRTPMNGVLGMLELLLNTSLEQKQEHFAHTAHRSGVALLHVINDVLDFSKIESGNLELERVDFDVREVVEETVEFLAERAHRKRLELLCFIGESVPATLLGDPHRLRQILTNLIANAIKFTEKGEVSLRVSANATEDEDVQLVLEVRDTGIGIDQKVQEKIFESFTQADNATTRRHGGTGLGLAITTQLVEAMDGWIELESALGDGSTFTATVVLGPPGSKGRVRGSDAMIDFSALRVLVVDDNATNRSILEHQLTRFGLENESAEDGSQGLERLLTAAESGTPFNLAILDMSMPGMDGIQLARAIRSQPELAGIRLLMLTSVGDFGDAELARQAGIEIYLTKPVRQSYLYDALVDLLQGIPSRRSVAPAVPTTLRFDPEIRVLLAEDHRVNQEVATAMLEGFGCFVQLAEDGLEAVEASASSPFDIVLMDCQMPKLDGFEAARRISAQAPPVPPIIALTAHAAEGDREQCLAAGMVGYVSKPFGREELFRALSEIVGAERVAAPPKALRPEPQLVEAHSEPAALRSVLREEALDRIRALESESRPDVMKRVLRLYLDDTSDMVATMRAARDEGDVVRVKEVAHTLKSSSANLGAIDLSEICRSIESKVQEGRVEGLDDLFAKADRLQAEVQLEVRRRLDAP